MKKLLIILIFVIITTGTAFADHPNGLGIGIQGGFSGAWGGDNFGGGALSLKLPSLPIFWAARLDIWPEYLSLGISGDKYLIDQLLVKEAGLNWYLGFGIGAGIGLGNPLALGVSGRLPIGLSWQPIPLLEIFLQIVPSLGLSVLPEFHFPYGGWGGDIGIRIWI